MHRPILVSVSRLTKYDRLYLSQAFVYGEHSACIGEQAYRVMQHGNLDLTILNSSRLACMQQTECFST